MTSFQSSPVASLAYPRTGKRGVPQQFPRRLYEMLQSEAELARTDANHKDIITWSESGKAFRILNVALFSSEVLPKYFRTSKFSSFQRNLNLYGFSKVRRGPDTDMYAHASFVRGQAETLSLLRKCNSTAARKKLAISAESAVRFIAPPKIIIPAHNADTFGFSRAVSPSPPRVGNNNHHYIVPMPSSGESSPQQGYTPAIWPQIAPHVPKQQTVAKSCDSGKLDLLAMALTSMANRDAKFGERATAVQTA